MFGELQMKYKYALRKLFCRRIYTKPLEMHSKASRSIVPVSVVSPDLRHVGLVSVYFQCET